MAPVDITIIAPYCRASSKYGRFYSSPTGWKRCLDILPWTDLSAPAPEGDAELWKCCFYTHYSEVADLQATAQALQHNHDQHNNTITGLSIYAALLTAVFIAVLFRLCHYYKRATQKAHQDTNNSPLLYNPMQQKNNTYIDVDNPGVDNNVNKLDDGSEEALVPSPPDPVIRENKIIEDYNELENLAVDLAAEGS